MELVIAIALVAGVFLFLFGVRPNDLPPAETPSATVHLDEKKARIYEGLRDLQFEYRVGKLSEEDYQRTKTDLQRELATVMGDIERLGGSAETREPEASKPVLVCPHCKARFDKPMKFCGECGKSMEAPV